ncbi:MAG: hypothetical protein HY595_02190 [Candidatus Omnitrophica bacterium]|nr:hypothetical protein [Candidatus Omnitrophota bacterium]
MPLKILLVSLVCFLVNLPLGRMRERATRFFPEKFLWIHASIPFIIALRIGLHLHWISIPINIAAAVLGQLLGGLSEKNKQKAVLPSAAGS